MSNIQFQFFPKCKQIPDTLNNIVKVFKNNEERYSSSKFTLHSNEVLRIVKDDIKKLGFNVEESKKDKDKIQVPVLFGRNGSLEKYFEADCYNPSEKIVIEVEAGRAVTNYQFLKDIFQACVMHDIDYLVVAVRNVYRSQKDFDSVINFLDTLYASNRLKLPLNGILIIGY
jgi:hypothetical protein